MPRVNHIQRELDHAAAAADLLKRRLYQDDIGVQLVLRIEDALAHADRALSLLAMELDYRERGRI